ncbi:UDP-D-galactose:(glucosyl)lipopolysaccharide-1,6-D-galactosyltransferase, partial [mine drainage metagenome]
MHWVIILDNLGGRGGVESVVRLVSEEIARSKDSVSVYLPGPSEDSDWERDLPEVVYYDPVLHAGRFMGLQSTWRRVLGLRRQMELRRPADVVVAGHVPRTALYARMAIGYGKTPIVSWLHNPPEAFHEPEHIQYADLHWAIAAGIAAKVQAIVRGARRVVQVGNPIRLDVAEVAQPGDKEPARFLYVGRLENAQKRVDVCIRGLALLDRPWTLDVYGDGPDAPGL